MAVRSYDTSAYVIRSSGGNLVAQPVLPGQLIGVHPALERLASESLAGQAARQRAGQAAAHPAGHPAWQDAGHPLTGCCRLHGTGRGPCSHPARGEVT